MYPKPNYGNAYFSSIHKFEKPNSWHEDLGLIFFSQFIIKVG